jgi:hypothetical protein
VSEAHYAREEESHVSQSAADANNRSSDAILTSCPTPLPPKPLMPLST